MFFISKNCKMRYSHLKVFLRLMSANAQTGLKKKVYECECLEKLRESLINDESKGFVVPLFKRALLYSNDIAIKDMAGEYSYYQLYMTAKKLSIQISNICGSASCTNVGYLCSNNAISPILQWACWISGQVAVPLVYTYPMEMLRYIIRDAGVRLIISTTDHEREAQNLAQYFDVALLVVDHNFITPHNILDSVIQKQILIGRENRVLLAGTLSNDFYTNADAMILYTSVISAKPIGVVLTHKNLFAQVNCLLQAWNYTSNDSVLHVLSQNHIHSYFKALLCPLSIGAKVVIHEQFNSHNVWKTILGINTPAKERVNVFIGVPTMYIFLISEYEKIFSKNSQMVEYIKNFCKTNLRLMISGSAPLPEVVFNRWKEITGHSILERYGMAEIGMALSNPYFEQPIKGKQRTPGVVGLPLPGVQLRVIGKDSEVLLSCKGVADEGFWSKPNTAFESVDNNKQLPETSSVLRKIVGELEVGGPNVFKGYFNQPELTNSNLKDGFFKTGDEVSYENGVFKIMERTNADIINTGGYKVYCFEIESALRSHPSIQEIAVFGVPDPTWGERIGAICVLYPKSNLDLQSIKSFCSQILPTYKHPSILKVVEEIPRNSISEIDRKQLSNLFLMDKTSL